MQLCGVVCARGSGNVVVREIFGYSLLINYCKLNFQGNLYWHGSAEVHIVYRD